MSPVSSSAQALPPVEAARATLDTHVRDIIAWHFSPETGCDHWLDFARKASFNPLRDIQGVDDIFRLFDHFDADQILRYEPHERLVPRAFRNRPYCIFETGGTTGMPKQRIGWDDYKIDYEQFSDSLDDAHFPPGGHWLMIGPTGPRRLRLAIEHLANYRGSSCYFIDLDPRWVKKVLSEGDTRHARDYMQHVSDQAVMILKHRKVDALFTTPRLLEALAERVSIPGVGVKGIFVGGTTMTPQYTRFLVEEVLENAVGFYPTYGNTLMGLAAHKPGFEREGYSITYHAPQPRAVLRVVDPQKTSQVVGYDQWGRVELTTLTKELFMPRFLERDEALRRKPCDLYPWDGVGEIRPFGQSTTKIVEGVY